VAIIMPILNVGLFSKRFAIH